MSERREHREAQHTGYFAPVSYTGPAKAQPTRRGISWLRIGAAATLGFGCIAFFFR